MLLTRLRSFTAPRLPCLFLLGVACLAICAPAAAQQGQGLDVYVLEQGQPVAGLAAILDGEPRGETDRNGSLRLEPEAGAHELALTRKGEPVFQRQFEIAEGERAQWIVNLIPGQPARVSVESSRGAAATEAAGAGGAASEPSGPPGKVRGTVVAAETGKPVSGATVYISGTPVQLKTDAQGQFTTDLSPGEYAISITHPDFSTRTLEGIKVSSDTGTPLKVELTPAGLELAEYVVVEPYVEGSLTSVMVERRESDAVTDVLSAEQISRAGDSDAAGALKRVTGLTLVDGQYIYVRGLGERYSSVLLNGAAIPSPDPTRRVVPLNLFPTDVIKSVVIQKTESADMPGDFGGGTVQLRTVSFPDTFLARLKVKTAYQGNASFEKGVRYDGGGRDWTGFDDGTRSLPDSIAEEVSGGRFLTSRSPSNPEGLTQDEIEVLGEDLAGQTSYVPKMESLNPDVGLSGSLGNSFAFGDNNRWGFLTAFQYEDSWSNYKEKRRTFAATNTGLQPQNDLDVQRTVRNVDLSGFANLGLQIGENNKLGLNSMFLHQAEDEAKISTGEEVNQFLTRVEFQWIENELFSNQLTGEHTFPILDWGLDMNLNWQYTDASASRHEPNTVRYRRDDDNQDGVYVYSTRNDSNSQTFADLNDNLTDWSFSGEVPFSLGSHVDVKLSYGRGLTTRDREAMSHTFGYSGRIPGTLTFLGQGELFTPQYIGPGGLTLGETTRPDDNYTATQTLASNFWNADVTLFDDWRLTAGLRNEDNSQEVVTADITNPNAPPVVGGVNEKDHLPSAALTWSYSDNAQFRLSYADSVNRPDFRELSPAPFLDPILDLITVGNPDLKSASINNYDARWEYYFSPTDSFSVAVFYKDFTDPIEKTFSSGGSAKIITLQNAVAAKVQGVEFDLYRSLGFANDLPWVGDISLGPLGSLDWSRFHVAANYARIQSSVDLSGSVTTQTNVDRPLQGQSPYVGNFQVGYTSQDERTEWTLLYNEFGKRISQAGVRGQPDIYEQPFPQLDFVFRRHFADHWLLQLKLGNLLDPNVKFTQGDQTTRLYKKGRELSVGLSWSY